MGVKRKLFLDRRKMMHYVVVPEPITLMDHETGEPMVEEHRLADGSSIKTDRPRKPMTLFNLICDIAFNDILSFGEGWKPAVALQAIHAKFKDAKSGDVVELEDDHYERLKGSLLMEKEDARRSQRMNPKILFQIIPLLAAIRDAKDTHPEKTPPPAKKK